MDCLLVTGRTYQGPSDGGPTPDRCLFGQISDKIILYYSDFILFCRFLPGRFCFTFWIGVVVLLESFFLLTLLHFNNIRNPYFWQKKLWIWITKLFIMNILSTQHVCFLSKISFNIWSYIKEIKVNCSFPVWGCSNRTAVAFYISSWNRSPRNTAKSVRLDTNNFKGSSDQSYFILRIHPKYVFLDFSEICHPNNGLLRQKFRKSYIRRNPRGIYVTTGVISAPSFQNVHNNVQAMITSKMKRFIDI